MNYYRTLVFVLVVVNLFLLASIWLIGVENKRNCEKHDLVTFNGKQFKCEAL